jgi:hypothetical protein
MVECGWWDPADSHGGQCGVARSGEKICTMSINQIISLYSGSIALSDVQGPAWLKSRGYGLAS